MYGMLLESVQHYLQLKYGKEFWDKICLHAGVTNSVFVTHECYSDSLIPRIAKACASEYCHKHTSNAFMEFFGRCFLRFSSHYGYDRVLKVYGRNFRDFLHGIDNLHEHMRFGFPRLQSPSFRCEQETSTGLTLHYRSKRLGFKMYVIGQIKECALLFFNMDIDVQVLKESGCSSDNDSTKSHVIYRVVFDNTKYTSILREPTMPFFGSEMPIGVLFEIFPFSFVLNENLTFEIAGDGLRNFLGYSIAKMNINDVFTLRRPIATLTWAKLLTHERIIFELISKHVMSRKQQHGRHRWDQSRLIPVLEEKNESEEEARADQKQASPYLQTHKLQVTETTSLPLDSVSTKKNVRHLEHSQRHPVLAKTVCVSNKSDKNFQEHGTTKSEIKRSKTSYSLAAIANISVDQQVDEKSTLANKKPSSPYLSVHQKLAMTKSTSFTRYGQKKEEKSHDLDGILYPNLARRSHSLEDQSLKLNYSVDPNRLVERPTEKPLHLKGQMLYIKSWNKILFIGAPIIGTLEDLRETGLYLNDLSMYDGSRQMVLAGTQKLSQLELSRDMETLYGKMLRETTERLDKEKHKSDQLLYSLMPKEIAERLKNGECQMDTCETFDDVTILFGYIEGFDAICESAEPMLVVKLINEIFSVFDGLTEKHNVYKFETLGDAIYMLVSGAPIPAKNHAHEMAYMALDMLEEVKRIKTPEDSDPLKLRIGMHSGPVVAGVIGEKTPQYCLFGNTVNMASRMQSTGKAMKIHISNETCTRLHGSKFKTEGRGSINVKGVGSMETFWLVGLEQEEQGEQKDEITNAECSSCKDSDQSITNI